MNYIYCDIKRFLRGACLGLVILIGAAPLLAQEDLYTVRDINVDVTAGSAVTAQEHAMTQAREQAFRVLLSRILSPEDLARVGEVADEKIESFVIDYEVLRQKNSSVRYMANLTYRFNGGAVKRFLKNRTVSVDESPKSPIVVIPIFKQGDSAQLWGDDNAWLGVWANRQNFSSRTPIVVPMGDLRDINDLSVEQVLAGDVEGLKKIARRYGAGAALVAVAQPTVLEDENVLELNLTKVTLDDQTDQLNVDSVPMKNRELGEVLGQGVARVLASVNGAKIKREHEAVAVSGPQKLHVSLPLSNLGDWLKLKQTLSEINTIRELKLISISNNAAEVTLTHSGSEHTLASALGARGLALTKTGDSSWSISHRMRTQF